MAKKKSNNKKEVPPADFEAIIDVGEVEIRSNKKKTRRKDGKKERSDHR